MTRSIRSQRREAERDRSPARAIQKDAQHWIFSPREHESAWYQEVLALPKVKVDCPEILPTPLLVANHCHSNCYHYRREHPSSRIVHGWMVYAERAVVHSVMYEEAHGHFCVTPKPLNSAIWYPFTPDPELVVEYNPEGVGACKPITRRGIAVGFGVRKDPQQFMAFYKNHRNNPAMLLAGMARLPEDSMRQWA